MKANALKNPSACLRGRAFGLLERGLLSPPELAGAFHRHHLERDFYTERKGGDFEGIQRIGAVPGIMVRSYLFLPGLHPAGSLHGMRVMPPLSPPMPFLEAVRRITCEKPL